MSSSSMGFSNSVALPTDMLLGVELLLKRAVGVKLSPKLSPSILLIIPEGVFFSCGGVKEKTLWLLPLAAEDGEAGDCMTSRWRLGLVRCLGGDERGCMWGLMAAKVLLLLLLLLARDFRLI